ncbi:hypothetical protein KQI74_27995 [Paenibacillus barcinonensis]|uniref:hypothetical protein n=1 Tax=Paenibacillus barcinonensis TaxID=198119 RepID=UPI001C11717B|nr:hypothetical protein [Paenibacillus barcinonensis]MBU5356098.1 hypothetical protein [Paenibacillus barcinonensis]
MSEQLAQMIIDNYVSSTLALRVSSAIPAEVAAADTDAYSCQRLDVYIRWENAKLSLQELPHEYKLQAIQAIEQITA